ncbi:hypothetical protein [Paraglaciecola sp. MB-3u-78]|jgi:hypothetical protein|uniref:hypothetical protein n=1 Tax=Paraglaciecola sp. MB-3u-78 TaxID=2058332 RepID=UPI000C34B2FD|nr:hypothetical protein [Paraglaciecola sp. MB-3u-78]PKG98096.1 hypothetical protein CXF95_17055 [Paraglaciecola sp. MB-3u-78]
MDVIETVFGIILILFLSFCGVFAPMLMPLFVKDEYKDKFPSYMDSIQPPYVYQSKWFKPKGVILQRLALMIWIPSIFFVVYMLVTGQLKI